MKESELIFGIRAVIEAVQAGKEVDKIMVKRDLQGELVKELFEILRGWAGCLASPSSASLPSGSTATRARTIRA